MGMVHRPGPCGVAHGPRYAARGPAPFGPWAGPL